MSLWSWRKGIKELWRVEGIVPTGLLFGLEQEEQIVLSRFPRSRP